MNLCEWDVRQNVGLITAIKLMRNTCTAIMATLSISLIVVSVGYVSCVGALDNTRRPSKQSAQHKAKDTLLQLIVGVSEHLVP